MTPIHTDEQHDALEATDGEQSSPGVDDGEASLPGAAMDEPTAGDHLVEEASGDEALADSDDVVADDSGAAPRKWSKSLKWSINWRRVLAFGILPAVIVTLTVTTGFFKWQESSIRNSEAARVESVQVAKDTTVAMLSYEADTVEEQLRAAGELLTGQFRDAYASLINDIVIPGAKKRQISSEATVPAAASVSATPTHAVVLAFINQTVYIGKDAPSATASSVRVTLDKVGGRWLISAFDPI
ncbi:hypothetical protein [[Mycobacterium] vasticus]|uniref:Mce associated membrane protein n=1 Tax=[Mycobacterium] vasticus TaxID=2875777 RepID=A0ABU5Z2M6_9MYCO|nr:hypothetical protein [Mycolicibacter sp. MYC017]MEB3071663.1 hypothetical protein [Mycolicibacter sp. MYC017]